MRATETIDKHNNGNRFHLSSCVLGSINSSAGYISVLDRGKLHSRATASVQEASCEAAAPQRPEQCRLTCRAPRCTTETLLLPIRSTAFLLRWGSGFWPGDEKCSRGANCSGFMDRPLIKPPVSAPSLLPAPLHTWQILSSGALSGSDRLVSFLSPPHSLLHQSSHSHLSFSQSFVENLTSTSKSLVFFASSIYSFCASTRLFQRRLRRDRKINRCAQASVLPYAGLLFKLFNETTSIWWIKLYTETLPAHLYNRRANFSEIHTKFKTSQRFNSI